MLANFKFNVPHYWKKSLWAVLLVLFLSVVIFFNTWSEIVSTWARSKTYTHGFVVAPISLWLIWSRRSYYSQLNPQPYWAALPLIFIFGILYLAADLIHVQVIGQFAVVGMLLTGIWVVLGNVVVKNMLFPLLFLFFMVPAGDQLVAPLMDFTATFTVNLLRLTGISVYREGTFFTLTSGNWSVVEACSGINYLIASLTLGFVYAYLNYSSYWRRGVFMLLSGVIPVFANGFRAYMIVMIGHLSGMKLAVGVDHIIYGGIFFGIVMLVLFYVGSFWREPVLEPTSVPSVSGSEYTDNKPVWLAILLVGLGYMVWPPSSAYLEAKQTLGELPSYLVKMDVSGWQSVPSPQWSWVPKYNGVVGQKTEYFSDGTRVIGLYNASFGKETQGGAELINGQNTLIHLDFKSNWRIILRNSLLMDDVHSAESVLNGEGLDLLVFEWYQIGDKATANEFLAKWYQLCKRITGNIEPELKTIVWTQTTHEHHELAESALKAFIKSWRGGMDKSQ